jgi:hypothetical protein
VHLLPDALQHGEHLHRHAAGNDHQVALSRAEAKYFRAEAGQVMLARTGRHQLDAAARGRERHRPEAILSAPTGKLVELSDDDVVGQVNLGGL